MTWRQSCLALLLVLLALPASATGKSDAGVTEARNLQQDAQVAGRKGIPVLIVFTAPDCRYCDRVINYYLVPMQRNPQTAGTVLIRSMDMTKTTRLVDFSGHVTTERAFAKSLGVHFAPTVMVFTPGGKPGARPLVGLGPEDYYGGFLDQAIAATRAKITGPANGRG